MLIVMKLKKVHIPWKTREVPKSHWASVADYGLNRPSLFQQTTSPTHGPTGALDEISLALQMALLYALDLSVLHRYK